MSTLFVKLFFSPDSPYLLKSGYCNTTQTSIATPFVKTSSGRQHVAHYLLKLLALVIAEPVVALYKARYAPRYQQAGLYVGRHNRRNADHQGLTDRL